MDIKISVESCQDCPMLKIKRVWTADSWEEGFDWFCKGNNNKIAEFVEWHEVKDISIPTWCPKQA